ncbi:MAG: hypothetical protein V4469_03600 [Patescibacteria group bacterium]
MSIQSWFIFMEISLIGTLIVVILARTINAIEKKWGVPLWHLMGIGLMCCVVSDSDPTKNILGVLMLAVVIITPVIILLLLLRIICRWILSKFHYKFLKVVVAVLDWVLIWG